MDWNSSVVTKFLWPLIFSNSLMNQIVSHKIHDNSKGIK